MESSLKSIAIAMNQFTRVDISLRKLLSWHKAAPSNISTGLKEIARRHASGSSVACKFLSYNTYLLEALHVKLPDPFADLVIGAKAEVPQRAFEIGSMITTENYDFVSLYEIMNDSVKGTLLSGLGASPKDLNFGGDATSLLTLSRTFSITRREFKAFANTGKSFNVDIPLIPNFTISLDSDFYARKGVLLTEIETGLTTLGSTPQPILVEIYSAHLMFGGGFGKSAEDAVNTLIPLGERITPSNTNQRFELEMKQVDELLAFYRNNHNPNNVAIVCGDFNIDGSNPSRFEMLKGRFEAHNMLDAWVDSPLGNCGAGQSSRNDDGDGIREDSFDKVCFPLDVEGAADYCDESVATISSSEFVGRFDYIFIENPTDQHFGNVDFSRLRRRQFMRHQPQFKQRFLSDHLGLETTFFFSQRS